MCGFAVLTENGRTFAPDLLAAIDSDLYHRGPDSGGLLSQPGLALVFRRLAILDVGAQSDQPMTDPSGRCTLVFNGEIYNFKSLRRELEAAGAVFRTSGDSEVILAAYLAWGEAAFARLEGMFALVLVDRARNSLVAVRDPFGIKPLYVARHGRCTAFASELRPLRRMVGTAVDPAAFAELLTYRFAAGRLSNLRHIELLPGGSIARVDLADGNYSETRFCDVLDTLKQDRSIGSDAAAAIVETAVGESVEAHMQSDVGYAVELSGGVDSSLVAALVSQRAGGRVRSYGIDLGDSPLNERRWRDMVIAGRDIDHREVPLDGRAFAAALPDAVRAMEGPVPHLGCVMLMLLCRQIAKTDKVVLTGEGADEMFGGYARYARWRQIARQARLARAVPTPVWPLLGRWRWLRRYAQFEPAAIAGVYFDPVRLAEAFPGHLPQPGTRDAVARRFADFRDRLFAVDQTTYLASLLMRQDRMSMAASVEARVPFTHLPLARAVNVLPHALRAPGGETKPLLKAFAERLLPRDVVRRRKLGLNLPYDEWLRDEAALAPLLPLLTDADSALAPWGERKVIARWVDEFRAGTYGRDRPPLVHLLNMELWLRSLREPPGPLRPVPARSA
ncbi:MAG: asparagine synthase (glutamine-hydrolyzing) [Alphaproteobacteria bacterium]